MSPRFTRLAALAAALLLAACGGSDDPAPPSGAVTVDNARTARATVGPAGGSVSATAADGRRYTLTVPPGALASATEISATPVTSMGDTPLAAGTRAAVRFGPAGLRFAMPARLRIEGASTTAGAGKRLVGFVRDDAGTAMNLQPPALAGAALELQVPHFSDVGVSEATPQEIALVPIVTPASVADEIFEAATRELPPLSSGLQAAADVFAAIHDRIVLRELDDATRAGTPEARLVAATAFGIWDRAIELSTLDAAQYQALVALLGDRYVLSRARAGAFVKQDVDAGLAACAAPAPFGRVQQDGLESALSLQVFAGQRGLDDADLGLDADTVARRANACARVAFVPHAVPEFAVGRAVSLDAQAELIFAADANFRASQPFAFTVRSASAAVATPQGVGDAAGRYTTVVTPAAADPSFDVKACLMVVVPQPVAFMPEGLLSPSAMCVTQQVGGALTEVVLAGRLTRRNDALGLLGSVDLRVRYRQDGSVTVLQVEGGATRRGASEATCAGPEQHVMLSFLSENTLNQGRVVSSAAFALFGPQTDTEEQLVSPGTSCATTLSVTTTDDGDLLGTADVTAVTRDAAGLPLTVTIGRGGTTLSGTLVRE